MSTKIYVAYRLKPNVDLWDFAISTRNKAIENVRVILRSYYKTMQEIPDKAGRDLHCQALGVAPPLTKNEKPWSYLTCSELLREAFADQCNPNRYERHHAAIDVSIAFRKLGRRWYLIPYANGMMGKALDFLTRDHRLDYFGYWNNTDRLGGTSAREWEQRRKVWDTFNTPDSRWSEKLVLEIVEPSFMGWYSVSPPEK